MSILGFFESYSSPIQTISTFILVIITGYYTYLNKRTLKEISNQRQDSLLPFVIAEKFEINNTHGPDMCVESYLRNVGSGPALNIMVSFLDEETGEMLIRSSHFLPYIYPNQEGELHIHILKDDLESLTYKHNSQGHVMAGLDCIIDFEDLYGRKMYVIKNFVLKKNSKIIESTLGEIYFSYNHDESNIWSTTINLIRNFLP